MIKKDETISIIYASIKAPEIVPKGFDTVLSTAFGLFGILFFLFLLIVNQEKNTLLEWLSFLTVYYTIFYSLMRSVFIVFSPFSLLNYVVLLVFILLPSYLVNNNLFLKNYQSLLIFWVPIIALYLLPFIAKSLRTRKPILHP
jgi:hypothetical protein